MFYVVLVVLHQFWYLVSELECASDQPSIVLEDLNLGEVEEVKTTMLPMVHKVQDEIMLIPHINFVIPKEFDVVKFKNFLFSVLLKVIPTLSKCYLSTS